MRARDLAGVLNVEARLRRAPSPLSASSKRGESTPLTISLVVDSWAWIERISWIVTIVGIPAVIVGLLAITRRPALAVGFLPLRPSGFIRRRQRPTTAIDFKLAFSLDPKLADAIELPLWVMNVGRSTARDLVVNFKFGSGLDLKHVAPPNALTSEFMIDPRDKRPLWAFTQPHLHPSDHIYFPTAIRVPAGISRLDINFGISMADAREVKGTLRVNFS